jgi:hypothetical protein
MENKKPVPGLLWRGFEVHDWGRCYEVTDLSHLK